MKLLEFISAELVQEIVRSSGLYELLDGFGKTYFNALPKAQSEFGANGVKAQILYMLNNCSRTHTQKQKEAKKLLKKMARRTQGSNLVVSLQNCKEME